MAAAQADGGGGKLDAVEGDLGRIAADPRGELRAEPSGGGDAVACESRGEVHAVDFSGVRHYVKSEIESAAPDEFNFGVAQLGVDADHTAAENFRALTHGVFSFRKESGAASEEHAVVGREAVVVEKMFGVVDHAVAGAKFAGQVGGENFRGDDVRTDGNDLFSQGGSGFGGVRRNEDDEKKKKRDNEIGK